MNAAVLWTERISLQSERTENRTRVERRQAGRRRRNWIPEREKKIKAVKDEEPEYGKKHERKEKKGWTNCS